MYLLSLPNRLCLLFISMLLLIEIFKKTQVAALPNWQCLIDLSLYEDLTIWTNASGMYFYASSIIASTLVNTTPSLVWGILPAFAYLLYLLHTYIRVCTNLYA